MTQTLSTRSQKGYLPFAPSDQGGNKRHDAIHRSYLCQCERFKIVKTLQKKKGDKKKGTKRKKGAQKTLQGDNKKNKGT